MFRSLRFLPACFALAGVGMSGLFNLGCICILEFVIYFITFIKVLLIFLRIFRVRVSSTELHALCPAPAAERRGLASSTAPRQPDGLFLARGIAP